jgi:hypothetical protein
VSGSEGSEPPVINSTHLPPIGATIKKLKRSFDSRGRTLVYENLKGKVFSQLRVFQIGASRSTSMSIDLIFEDKTMLHIGLEPEPLVRLCHYQEDRAGNLEEITMNEKIPVPQNG